ncbi:hypothetical protein [Ignicoccus hospitalis]|uniref:hypothetical protein n=1 Tax=Ignicoccus hospitalis TaxID=160233 RepID=UPI0016505894|nr:hypothetical protein [Ignicoccus hospitalis]HIH90448.1 hypothetical protein [Desulfurococcaceae archaeon]
MGKDEKEMSKYKGLVICNIGRRSCKSTDAPAIQRLTSRGPEGPPHALSDQQPNDLIDKVLGVTYKLEAALALKALGYRVPKDLLEVPSISLRTKAEKAFVYGLVGSPRGRDSWRRLGRLACWRS